MRVINFFILVYKFIFGKPIYNIIRVLDDKDFKFDIVKSNISLNTKPSIGDKIYFKQKGPYYIVTGITHNINILHTIWISVEKIM